MYLGFRVGAGIDDFAHGAKIVARGIDTSPIAMAFWYAWFVDGEVLRIGMGRDKVDGKIIGVAVIEKVIDPHGAPWNCEGIERLSGRLCRLQCFMIHVEVARGGSAYAKLWVNFLDGLRCHLVQLEVFFLRAATKKRLIQIRLIPYFKVPLTYLI